MSGGELDEPGEEPQHAHQYEDAVPGPEQHEQLGHVVTTVQHQTEMTLPSH